MGHILAVERRRKEAAMKHYAGLDLSMETTQVCIVDETGPKIASMKVESSPEERPFQFIWAYVRIGI